MCRYASHQDAIPTVELSSKYPRRVASGESPDALRSGDSPATWRQLGYLSVALDGKVGAIPCGRVGSRHPTPEGEVAMEQPSVNLVSLNPQPLPPGATINLVALNPQPLPPDATLELGAPT